MKEAVPPYRGGAWDPGPPLLKVLERLAGPCGPSHSSGQGHAPTGTTTCEDTGLHDGEPGIHGEDVLDDLRRVTGYHC
jgi:hypothetical protein